jgi:class 3 adenylate cyclase
MQSGIVTLLFTDLANSIDFLGHLGGDRGQQLLLAHHQLISEAVNAFGGEELEWMGHGALAAFSSAADAVRCAIQVQRMARRPAAGARFEIRIGIHVGEALRREGGYFGTTVVLARRLCDRAASGQILCSRLISQLLAEDRTFDFRDLGNFGFKGLTAAIGVSEVIYLEPEAVEPAMRSPVRS